MDRAPHRELRLLFGIAIAEGEAPLLPADPVLAVRDAAAEAVRVIGELLRAALLPVEEGPPSRLRLAAMKADEVRHELPRPGIRRLRVCNERGLERRLVTLARLALRARGALFLGLRGRFDAGRRPAAGLPGAGDEPVAQQQRGEAVVAVVVADLVEQRDLAGLAVPVVDDDAVAARDNLRRAGRHVEALEALDRVARLADAHRLAHHPVQVHHAVRAQQLVHGAFRRRVHRGEAAQRRLLVGRVMIEVGAGRTAEPAREEGHQLREGALLLHPVVGPEGLEAQLRPAGYGLALRLAGRGPPEHAAEIFETARVHRVALEVEEEVVRVGRGQPVEAEPRRGVEGLADTDTGGRALLLQPRLLREPLQRLRRNPGNMHAVEGSQQGERADACRGQPLHLLLGDIGDAAEVVRPPPSAPRTPPASDNLPQ